MSQVVVELPHSITLPYVDRVEQHFIAVQFVPPIDLSVGFTLNAVARVVGTEHRLDTDALASRSPTASSTKSSFWPSQSRPRRRWPKSWSSSPIRRRCQTWNFQQHFTVVKQKPGGF